MFISILRITLISAILFTLHSNQILLVDAEISCDIRSGLGCSPGSRTIPSGATIRLTPSGSCPLGQYPAIAQLEISSSNFLSAAPFSVLSYNPTDIKNFSPYYVNASTLGATNFAMEGTPVGRPGFSRITVDITCEAEFLTFGCFIVAHVQFTCLLAPSYPLGSSASCAAQHDCASCTQVKSCGWCSMGLGSCILSPNGTLPASCPDQSVFSAYWNTDSDRCNLMPIVGGWSVYSDCVFNSTCADSQTPFITGRRFRSCTNPTPDFHGFDCQGSTVALNDLCIMYCNTSVIDGGGSEEAQSDSALEERAAYGLTSTILRWITSFLFSLYTGASIKGFGKKLVDGGNFSKFCWVAFMCFIFALGIQSAIEETSQSDVDAESFSILATGFLLIEWRHTYEQLLRYSTSQLERKRSESIAQVESRLAQDGGCRCQWSVWSRTACLTAYTVPVTALMSVGLIVKDLVFRAILLAVADWTISAASLLIREFLHRRLAHSHKSGGASSHSHEFEMKSTSVSKATRELNESNVLNVSPESKGETESSVKSAISLPVHSDAVVVQPQDHSFKFSNRQILVLVDIVLLLLVGVGVIFCITAPHHGHPNVESWGAIVGFASLARSQFVANFLQHH